METRQKKGLQSRATQQKSQDQRPPGGEPMEGQDIRGQRHTLGSHDAPETEGIRRTDAKGSKVQEREMDTEDVELTQEQSKTGRRRSTIEFRDRRGQFRILKKRQSVPGNPNVDLREKGATQPSADAGSCQSITREGTNKEFQGKTEDNKTSRRMGHAMPLNNINIALASSTPGTPPKKKSRVQYKTKSQHRKRSGDVELGGRPTKIQPRKTRAFSSRLRRNQRESDMIPTRPTR